MSYLENAMKMRPYIEKAAASLSDAEALEVPTIFPAWAVGEDYEADERIEYGGNLYRCVQAHRSQTDWTPPATPALWVLVSLEEWPDWVQPLGAHDAYNIGAKRQALDLRHRRQRLGARCLRLDRGLKMGRAVMAPQGGKLWMQQNWP